MASLARMSAVLQTLLLTRPDDLARATGLVKRKRVLDGSTWVRTLVLGWGEHPRASLEDLADVASSLGADISPQGLDGWFCSEGAACLQQVVQFGVGTLIETDEATLPLLQRFSGVFVEDCTSFALAPSLAEVYPGCGGSDEQGRDRAAMKAFVRMELRQGNVTEISFLSGRHSDVRAGQEATPLPAGALRLYDLGFFDTRVMADDTQRDVHWISRVPTGIFLKQADTATNVEAQEISVWLQKQTANEVDCQVELGKETPLSCRLIAVRCPEEVRERRLRKLEQKARKDGRRPVSERQRIMGGWLVLITDLPVNELTIDEAWVLYRTRWQIELLFKLWKSHGGVHEWRGKKPDRVLCEIFAKLLAMLAKHWMMLLAGPWLDGKGALAKARRVRRRLSQLLVALADSAAVETVLENICAAFTRLKRRGKRHKRPLTTELLNHPAGAKLGLS